jgi:sterol desaturase/sphingolipid hydroxylase (fatty acid hydroxylase superfamily)
VVAVDEPLFLTKFINYWFFSLPSRCAYERGEVIFPCSCSFHISGCLDKFFLNSLFSFWTIGHLCKKSQPRKQRLAKKVMVPFQSVPSNIFLSWFLHGVNMVLNFFIVVGCVLVYYLLAITLRQAESLKSELSGKM